MTNMEKTLEALEDVVKVSYSKVVKWTCVGDLCISACYRCTNEGELQPAWYALLSSGDLRMHWMYRRWSLRMAGHGSWGLCRPVCAFYPNLFQTSRVKARAEFVQKLFSEGDCIHGEENLLRDAWRQDVIECLQYEKNQRKTGDIYVYPSFVLRWRINMVTLFLSLSFWTDWKPVQHLAPQQTDWLYRSMHTDWWLM